MVYIRTGLNRNVFYTVFSYRIIYPYGKSLSNNSFFVLINYDKKMLINTGVIESQSDLESIFNAAGCSYRELDYVVNMSSRPEHIGLNSIIQYNNKKTVFYSPESEIPFIEDTVRQHEERYVSGFYRLVSGNTAGVQALPDGHFFDLGDEIVTTVIKDGEFYLQLDKSGIIISKSEVAIPAGNNGIMSDIVTG